MLRSPDAPTDASITGHIDFLQVRNGAVHILDYKPDARTNRPIAQLTIYALALTRLVPGFILFDIKCGWFNEKKYCEFFPRTVLAGASVAAATSRKSQKNLDRRPSVERSVRKVVPRILQDRQLDIIHLKGFHRLIDQLNYINNPDSRSRVPTPI